MDTTPDIAAQTADAASAGMSSSTRSTRAAKRFLALAVWLVAAAVLVAAATGGARLVMAGRQEVIIAVDGHEEAILTNRPDVAGLLDDLGLVLVPEDRVTPPPDTPLGTGAIVRVARARRALVNADGRLQQVFIQGTTVGDVVRAAGLHLAPQDEVLLDGQAVMPDTPLPEPPNTSQQPQAGLGHAWDLPAAPPLHLSVRRALAMVVDDGSVPYTILTTAATVGEALIREQLTLYLGDRVQPSLGTAVSAGLHVRIERSKPIILSADGRTVHTRTRGETVGAVLMDLGMPVAGLDQVTPNLAQPVVNHMAIRVTRVSQLTLVEQEPISYESILVPDDNLEIDQQRLAQEGQDGELRRRWRVVREDGVEVSKVLIDEWVARPPVTRMVAYGRKIVYRTLDSPEGPVTYWRKIRMYATSYSPARAGTPVTAPWYGRTRIGLNLRKGIVAVDPTLIPLRSWVYVPGYGKAIAGDTGGGVKGKWIDMGYEDHDYVSWHWWTDVYVLDPPPTTSRIMWVLPNYPPPDFPRRR